ncbi:hypothetical protein ACKWTF_006202 [Chironomus riparius]
MVLKKLRSITYLYLWLWLIIFGCFIISDNFKGIDGIKRQKQFEFTLIAATCFVCFQLWTKSVMFFVLMSIWRKNDEFKNLNYSFNLNDIPVCEESVTTHF